MSNWNRILCVLPVVFLFTGWGVAQERSPSGFHVDSVLQKKPWSFQFRSNENFTFGSFEGSILSVKYHFSPGHALRLGLSADFGDSEQDQEKYPNLDTTQVDIFTQEDNSFATVISLLYLRHYSLSSRFLFYWGAGPTFNISRERNTLMRKRVINDTLFSQITDTYTGTANAFGIKSILGGELFLSSRISIIAEYGLLFNYRRSTGETSRIIRPFSSEKPRRSLQKNTQNQFSIRGLGGRIGVSLYF